MSDINPTVAAPKQSEPAILYAGGRPRNPAGAAKMFSAAFAGLDKPLVAYVGTANGDSLPFFQMMKSQLVAGGAGKVVRLRLAKDKSDLEKAIDILNQAEMIFFSGGEVEDGMVWLKKHNLIGLLHELYQQGRRFVGVSAGTIMLGSHWVHWDVEGDDDTSSLFDCLGVVPRLFDVHGESENWVELKAALKLLGDGALGYGLCSGCSISADSQGNLLTLEGDLLVFANQAGVINQLPG